MNKNITIVRVHHSQLAYEGKVWGYDMWVLYLIQFMLDHINVLVQERCNYIANTLE